MHYWLRRVAPPSIAEVYGRSSGDAKASSLGTLMWGTTVKEQVPLGKFQTEEKNKKDGGRQEWLLHELSLPKESGWS